MRTILSVLLLILTFGFGAGAWAHAFPKNSSPRANVALSDPPVVVKIWFDGEIAPVFSTLIVKDASGRQVSEGKGDVAKSDDTLLETRLPAKLSSGKYSVYWSVIARDGHHTAGHYSFTIK